MERVEEHSIRLKRGSTGPENCVLCRPIEICLLFKALACFGSYFRTLAISFVSDFLKFLTPSLPQLVKYPG